MPEGKLTLSSADSFHTLLIAESVTVACKREILVLCYLDTENNSRRKLVHLKREGSETSVHLICGDFVKSYAHLFIKMFHYL